MSVEFIYEKNTLTAVVSGEIDHHSAAETRIMTDGELSRTMPRTLIFDMKGVTFMDSSGVGLILGRAREMQPWGGKVMISEPSARAEKILKLSGLGSMIIKKAGKDQNA
ncbi:MAG: anti-sigma factor antagonist [Ruminiclostridium sp.]|nr:anti-sigma factor antagonist [Ruminiclostridium sp.]